MTVKSIIKPGITHFVSGPGSRIPARGIFINAKIALSRGSGIAGSAVNAYMERLFRAVSVEASRTCIMRIENTSVDGDGTDLVSLSNVFFFTFLYVLRRRASRFRFLESRFRPACEFIFTRISLLSESKLFLLSLT
jgi:hypothetical protein